MARRKRKIPTDKETIEEFRRYLWIFRLAAGWRAWELSEKLGVTKTTIGKIECREKRLSIAYYLAIRYLLENEHDYYIDTLMHIMLDPKVKREEKEHIAQQAYAIRKKVGGKVTLKKLSQEFRMYTFVGHELVKVKIEGENCEKESENRAV